MRILAVGLFYPPHHAGGYELVCEGVMQAARARGHDVRVVVSDHQFAGVPLEGEQPWVDRSLRSYWDPASQQTARLGLRARVQLERANAEVLDRNLRDFVPDVVSWWGMGGLSLSLIERVRRRGLPSVLLIHDPWLSYGPEADSWMRLTRRLGRASGLLEMATGIPARYRLAEAGRFLFNSEYTRAEAFAAGVRPLDEDVLSPGIHDRFLSCAPAGEWRWRLLQIGRVHPDKGVDVSLEALALLPAQASLTIVGVGERGYEQELRDRAGVLGLSDRVSLAGAVATEALPAIYAQADAVLFPVRWEEPWGLVPIEAMGIGRPVVATARGGAAGYLRDGENALVVAPEDPAALAAAVRRLADDSALRAHLREGGRLTAERHTATRFEHDAIAELERAAGGRSSG